MASLTGLEFYNYILRVFKRTDKETEIYEAITDVIMDIKLRYTFEDFKTVKADLTIPVANDYTIDIPVDFGHLIGDIVLQGDTDRVLTKISKPKYDELYPEQTASDVSTGVPLYYCLFGNKFYIAPVPDKTTYTYQINYTTEAETQIISSTDDVPFTDKYRWVLRSLVLAEMYYNMGNDVEAQKWEQRGEAKLGIMVASEQNNIDYSVNLEFNDL